VEVTSGRSEHFPSGAKEHAGITEHAPGLSPSCGSQVGKVELEIVGIVRVNHAKSLVDKNKNTTNLSFGNFV
jgi:hypothetical protein